MVFRNNDLPGVMLASAVQRAMRLWAVEVGRQAVVVTANPEGYAAALDLLDAGATLKAVLDLRPMPSACAARDELLARGVRVRDGWTVTAALPGRAGPRLEGVVIDRITGEGATRRGRYCGGLRSPRNFGGGGAARPARLRRRRAVRLR